MRRIAIWMVLFMLVGARAWATDWYFSTAATGANNGSNWTNAFSTWPSASWFTNTAARGDTFWVGDTDGAAVQSPTDNANFVINMPLSGTLTFTIKKATAAAHGTETGWSSAYGDGQFTWNGYLELNNGYYVIDGVVGEDDGSVTPHGICLGLDGLTTLSSPRDNYNIGPIYFTGAGVDGNNYFAHLDIHGGGEGPGPVDDAPKITCVTMGKGTLSSTMTYCYVHDFTSAAVSYGAYDSTIEHCWFAYRRGAWAPGTTSYIHGTAITWNDPDAAGAAMNSCIRYCTFFRISGTGAIEVTTGEQTYCYIYGNVFWNDGTYRWTNFAVGQTNSGVVDYFYVYNNTFWVPTDYDPHVGGWLAYGGVDFKSATHCVAQNNLFVNFDSHILFTATMTHDYNAFYASTGTGSSESNGQTLGADPLTDPPDDCHLGTNTNSGLNLGTSYNEDADGYLRETWSRGAFEYDGAVPPGPTPTPTPTPTPPPGGYSKHRPSVNWYRDRSRFARGQ